MAYSIKTVLSKLDQFEHKYDWSKLYCKCPLVANSNASTDGKPYSEVCAEWIKVRVPQMLKGIKQVTRKSSYHKAAHENLKSVARSIDGRTNSEARKECHLEQALYLEFKSHAITGKDNCGIELIDYEVPITDGRRGAIDLLGYSPSQDRLIFFELKFNDKKKESLLRCVLEALTYYKKIDLAKFKADFHAYDARITNKTSISIAPLFVRGGFQDKEWKALKDGSSFIDLARTIKANGIDVRIGILSKGCSTKDVANRELAIATIE